MFRESGGGDDDDYIDSGKRVPKGALARELHIHTKIVKKRVPRMFKHENYYVR
jgi:hypothetical protein